MTRSAAVRAALVAAVACAQFPCANFSKPMQLLRVGGLSEPLRLTELNLDNDPEHSGKHEKIFEYAGGYMKGKSVNAAAMLSFNGNSYIIAAVESKLCHISPNKWSANAADASEGLVDGTKADEDEAGKGSDNCIGGSQTGSTDNLKVSPNLGEIIGTTYYYSSLLSKNSPHLFVVRNVDKLVDDDSTSKPVVLSKNKKLDVRFNRVLWESQNHADITRIVEEDEEIIIDGDENGQYVLVSSHSLARASLRAHEPVTHALTQVLAWSRGPAARDGPRVSPRRKGGLRGRRNTRSGNWRT